MNAHRIWTLLLGTALCLGACDIEDDASLAGNPPGDGMGVLDDGALDDDGSVEQGPWVYVQATALCLTAPDEAPACGKSNYWCEGQDSDDDDTTCPIYSCQGGSLRRCDGERHPTNGTCFYNGPESNCEHY
jgi:hypothetical protein